MKISQIYIWQNLTKSDDETVRTSLTTKGLTDAARERFTQHMEANPVALATLHEVLQFLFTHFDHHALMRTLYGEYKSMKQGSTQITAFYHDFKLKVSRYRNTIKILRGFVDAQQLTLLEDPSNIDMYRTFLNALNAPTRDIIMQYIASHSIAADINILLPAIQYTQTLSNPGSGIRGLSTLKPNRSRSTKQDGRKRSGTANERGSDDDSADRGRSRSRRRRGDRGRGRGRERGRGRGDRGRGRRGRGGDASHIKCHSCGQYGHYANKCPNAKGGRTKTSGSGPRDLSHIKCYNCGKTGHYANKCSQPSTNNKHAPSNSDRNDSRVPKPSTRGKQSHWVEVPKGKVIHFVNAPEVPRNRDVSRRPSRRRRYLTNVTAEEMDNLDEESA